MNTETLILQVNRMLRNYDSKISDKDKMEKINFLRNELIKYTEYQFEKAVDSILNNANIKKFPTLAQIKSYIEKPLDVEKPKGCEKCEFTGYFNLWQKRKDRYYSFAYRCDCLLGEKHKAGKGLMPLIDQQAIPKRAHNPYPPNDIRHNTFNNRSIEGMGVF